MSACKSCGQPVTWAEHHESGNPMPLEPADEEQIEDGRGLWRVRNEVAAGLKAYPAKPEDAMGLFQETLYVSHFSNCPQAGAWRSDR